MASSFRGKISLFAAIALLLTGLTAGSGAQDVYMSIEKGFGEKIVVALPLFEGTGGLVGSSDVREVLTFDLDTSGHFNVIDNLAFVDETQADDRAEGKVNFPEWIALGGELLVKGSFDSGLSEFSIEATIYDLSQGEAILGRRYSSPAPRWRDAVHSISDDIVALIAGERGIALTKIAFVSNMTGAKEIYVMDYDGENMRRVTKDNLIDMYPAWFPGSQRIAYTRFRGQRQEACAVSVQSGATQTLTSFPGLNAFVAVAPNGESIAMCLSRDGNTELYRLRADGSDPKRLTEGRSTESSPCWSPDGRRIAFVSDRSGSPQIYVMSSTGGSAERLTYRGGYNTSPDWSPKGDLIAYTSQVEGVFQIFTVDVETKEVVRLTAGRENKEDPSWAPDGRHLVYSVKTGGKSDLYMIDIYEQKPLGLTSGSGDYLSPSWSF
ncbi:MAG: Tol-Pal system beta propeller repeat protein TolB [Candidatus Eisenbacteria bacterium]|nr:Tol-Pal system beta propeller repeat protein TolB [Candidatus Eisenbacteria bacterium]